MERKCKNKVRELQGHEIGRGVGEVSSPPQILILYNKVWWLDLK